MIRTPQQHYAAADRLLAEIEGCERPDLPFIRAKLNRAQVHAMLAQCPDWVVDAEVIEDDEPVNGYTPYPYMETRRATGDRL